MNVISVPEIREGAKAAPPIRGERIHALDMVKGLLVICMVIYHCLNYSQDYSLGFKYLPFLPPSFIFIAGFLIAHTRRNASGEKGLRFGRYIFKGIRLLALFTLLNVAIQLSGKHRLGRGSLGVGYFFDNWFEVYFSGEGYVAAFSILLAISYLLLLAPIFLLLDRWNRFFIPVIGIICVGAAVNAERIGEPAPNLALLSAGMLGFVAGRMPATRLLAIGRYGFIGVAGYLGYLFIVEHFGQPVLVHLLGAFFALLGLLGLSLAFGDRGFLQQRLINLGRYSLISYILQIAILQVLSQSYGRLPPFSAMFFLQMSGLAVGLILVVEALAWARTRSRLIRGAYGAVFA